MKARHFGRDSIPGTWPNIHTERDLVAYHVNATWMPLVTPYDVIWPRVLDRVRGVGLIHGSEPLDWIPLGCNRGPSDIATMLATMVSVGLIRECKRDVAGANRSMMVFRMLSPSAGGYPSERWCPSDACCWTYTPGDGAKRGLEPGSSSGAPA